MNFKLWIESHEENRTKNILSDYPNIEQIINGFKGITTNHIWWPILAIFYKEEPNLKILNKYMKTYFTLEQKGVLPKLKERAGNVTYGNKPLSFQEFKLIVKNKKKQTEGKIRRESQRFIFSNDKFDIYKAQDERDCIELGRNYSFCISKVKDNAYKEYRTDYLSTFYFVRDKKRTKEDPLHLVVVDVQKKDITVTNASNEEINTDKYLEYLEKRGVDLSIFKEQPLRKHEIEEKSLRFEVNFETFKLLDKKQLMTYISNVSEIPLNQFEYLMIKHPHIMKKHIETNYDHISEEQFEIMNETLKDFYIGVKVEKSIRFTQKEYERLTDEQKLNLKIIVPIDHSDVETIGKLIEKMGIKQFFINYSSQVPLYFANTLEKLIRLILLHDFKYTNDVIKIILDMGVNYDKLFNQILKFIYQRREWDRINHSNKINIIKKANITFILQQEKDMESLKELIKVYLQRYKDIELGEINPYFISETLNRINDQDFIKTLMHTNEKHYNISILIYLTEHKPDGWREMSNKLIERLSNQDVDYREEGFLRLAMKKLQY